MKLKRTNAMNDEAMLYTDNITRNTIRQMLSLPGTRFIGVTFVKKGETLRNMNCMVKGPWFHDEPTRKYVRVYDVKKRGYRRVNLDRIESIRMDGREFFVM